MKNLSLILALALLVALAPVPAHAAPTSPADAPEAQSCLYPSMHERFGVTGGVYRYDAAALGAGAYHNWWANTTSLHPNGMGYLPTVSTLRSGYQPSGRALAAAVTANPGALWIVGNEAETVWMHNLPPEDYARQFHDVRQEILALDPSARFAITSLGTVSPLRLAWLDRAWSTYRQLYGEDMPVDVWNVHTYMVNEMVHEWGPQLPAGFDNVVGYSTDMWTQVTLPQASGGTMHQSDQPSARAYFAFHGNRATLRLGTGPDAGIARIWVDQVQVEMVDLYAPEPGILLRSYENLVPGIPLLEDWHHVRVDVTWTANPASSGRRVRVDALRAPSTASLPGGWLQDDFPLRARIVTDIAEYADLDGVIDQLRLMRQWMADHGQGDKPLINTEFGILIGEDFGFGYPQVRDYMLEAFDRFVNETIDPELGLAADGHRLIQQWFWFTVAINEFSGQQVHTGFFDVDSGQMLPLGYEFANLVQGLVTDYRDLETTHLTLTPEWPVFAGQSSRVRVRATVRNRGNLPANQFRVALRDGSDVIDQWTVAGLGPAFGGNDSFQIDMDWLPVVAGSRPLSLIADSAGQVDEPCDSNNRQETVLEQLPLTDLALSQITMTPPFIPLLPPGQSANATFDVRVSNLGSQGTAANQVAVRFWDGQPGAGGTLLDTKWLPAGPGTAPVVSFEWRDIPPGGHQLVVELQAVSEESNLANNRATLNLIVPTGSHRQYLPAVAHLGAGAQPDAAPQAVIPGPLRHYGIGAPQ